MDTYIYNKISLLLLLTSKTIFSWRFELRLKEQMMT